jgi:ABC-type lipoprotein export system ATPase subunit/predicted GNAT family acetyltransferase
MYKKIYKKFKVEPNEKASLITEAFGIDAGYENEVVDISVPINFNIILITGESGSGKTTILNELKPNNILDLEIPNTPLFEWGINEEHTLKILSLVGLGDAVLFLTKYVHLSDSQQARARIALELLSDREVIYIDEFLSTLDRSTAKSVAYCIQKAIKITNKKAILVTAHDDLQDYLKPDCIIKGKAFPSRWVVEEKEYTNRNKIVEQCKFKYVDKEFYRNLRLGELHYKGKYTGGVKEYLAVMIGEECVGILVSIYRMHDGGRRISRVVVHPSYRGCGIGVKLVSKYIKKFKGADVVAAMAKYNPVFEKAGMTRVEDVKIKPPSGLKKELIKNNVDIDRWYSKSYCNEVMEDSNMREVLSKFSNKVGHLVCPGGKYLEDCEIKCKIKEDKVTSSRVLWGLRPRIMAKYKS